VGARSGNLRYLLAHFGDLRVFSSSTCKQINYRRSEMQFIAALPTFDTDQAAQLVWRWFAEKLKNATGVCYYKYPIVGFGGSEVPDLTLLVRGYQPFAVKCADFRLDDIHSITDDSWEVDVGDETESIESPFAIADDFKVWLSQRFERERPLRGKLSPVGLVAAPLVSRLSFGEKFDSETPDNAIWRDGNHLDEILAGNECNLSDNEWRLARSVLQAATPINVSSGPIPARTDTIGKAVRVMEKRIALLDEEQQRVAIQIPPGPQRIRGLAGTGKTVLLAMRASNIHQHYPDKRILFTFHTQSLYNQATKLITRFYRYHSDQDPDWSKIHVRHSWGGRGRKGVYSDLCKRQGVAPKDFQTAKAENPESPLQACYLHALQTRIEPYYDYVLVDEAQDFPKEFFRTLLKLTFESHAIYWAYDEMQSLTAVQIPSTEELFGKDESGKPKVSLDGPDYPGGMEKDFVLYKSYRCPHRVLMLAHALGLGLHNPRGPVQMLGDETSWNAIGYVLESGQLSPNDQVVLSRPAENSPNNVTETYTGDQEEIEVRVFDDRVAELDWIASSIAKNVNEEEVPPEQILVISLDSRRAKTYMLALQAKLFGAKIQSTIPGFIDAASAFAEPDKITLATVYRAKGNEAPVVYILSTDSLYDFAEEIENRNRAFTAISRSKGWVRITGTGKQMSRVAQEIKLVLSDLPRFRFIFPDMEKIRRLDAAETSRRRKVVRTAKEAALQLAKIDLEALQELDPSVRKKLLRRLKEAGDETH
jgi:superfamily I DNA and RNA helicase